MKKMKIASRYKGTLNVKSRFATVTVKLKFLNGGRIYDNLKGFVDTGASSTAVKESIISKDIDLNLLETKVGYGAGGSYKAYYIKNIGISIHSLLEPETYIPLDRIGTINSESDYDIIIGNDVLYMCDFIYSGITSTFELIMYQEE